MPLNFPKLAPIPLSCGRALPGGLALPARVLSAGVSAGVSVASAPTIPADPPVGTYGASRGSGGGQGIGYALDYAQKLRNLFGSAIVGYWVGDEPSGSVAFDSGPKNNPGVYTGVSLRQTGIGDGRTCPLYDGVTAFNNIYSAALASAFSPLQGTLFGWAKMSAAGVWSDATLRRLNSLNVDANNRVQVSKTATANQLTLTYLAGAVSSTRTTTELGATAAWFHVAITWNVSADQVIAYINGAQSGATMTGLGVWSGSLLSTQTMLGAGNTTPVNAHDGYLAHWGLLNRAATAGEVLAMATVP